MLSTRSIGNIAASAYLAVAAVFILMSSPSTVNAAAAVATPVVSQSPLSVGGNAPGNLLLTPSVEFPTVDSVANLGAYATSTLYTGYFDSLKCYRYQYYATETATDKNHFYPTSATDSSYGCSGSQEWSGNFLNWATTQTIDPFRKALTGGYRVVDTSSATILEKARSDGQSSSTYFPNRLLTDDTYISGATPASWGDFYMRISRLGNRLAFSLPNSVGGETSGEPTVVAYQGEALTNTSDTAVYVLNVRVKVCVSGMLESNCVGYPASSPTHYKPEGLIQKYAHRIRYSAFGYLNDHSSQRDGGVLRAQQKFVGPLSLSFNSSTGWVEGNNTAKEWDPTTGILEVNPDAADATNTTNVVALGSSYDSAQHAIVNSGVINYINKFGQTTAKNHKNYDPVSELYYTALRYLKNQGNVPAYTDLTGSALNRFQNADGFPVITSWNDPIQYTCQNNAILGIGDVYTHRDKNLPGDGTSTSDEPTKPTLVSGDTSVNARTETERVFTMEGLTINTGANAWTGRENSAFIAGLAYAAHTKDLRPDATNPLLPGLQTASTYWVDVRENQRLEDRGSNQYWLAAKYGGFEVPDNFNPDTATALPTDSWESSQTLSHWGGSSHNVSRTRPKNFYVASEADEMIASLTAAFANIVSQDTGSASSLAANSTRLDTQTRTFQAQFKGGIWGGKLHAFDLDDATGELITPAIWEASSDWDTGITGTPGAWAGRVIKAADETGTSLVNFHTGTGGLSAAQKLKFGAVATTQTKVVDYLRGERTNEGQVVGPVTFRVRESELGDIVNSTPLFIGAPSASLHAGRSYAGGSTYSAWASDSARTGRTPIVYVGANDGMLHAFNANTGKEEFAFVPNAVIDNGLASYADSIYEHKYFVDGESAAAEIFDTASSTWKTVLVGSLGRGGPGLFALDVTNPAAPTLMWEKDGTDISVLGKNIGRPVIAQVASGDWRVLLGNGADSGDGAYLVSITLGGATNGTVTTYAADTSSGNGLSALLVRDTDNDSFADTAYGGDLEGALWKISGIGGTMSALKLFQTADPGGTAQPITAAPMVGRDPESSNLWVFFGTGKYLNEDDIGDKQVQTWYGVIDNGSAIAGRSELVDRDILAEPTVSGVATRVIEAGSTSDMTGKKGWFIDLVSPTTNPTDGIKGERMVVQNRFQGQALIGTTRVPVYTDPCKPAGIGYVMSINPFTGARLNNTFFDVDGDGQEDQGDLYCDSNGCVPVSGIGFESSPNNPIFVENIMQVGLDDGTTEVIETFGSAVEASRMSWRELFNN